MPTFLKKISIKIPMDLVLSRLKFAKYKTKADKKILALVSEMIKEGHVLIKPAASYEIFEIVISDGNITFPCAGITIKSRSLAKHLKKSCKLALFVCTIGKSLHKRVDKYMAQEELTRAVILDAVGSEAVEALADSVNGLILQKAKTQGYLGIKRFSCGYGDWTISDQPKVLKLLKSNKIGVTASKSCIMIPEKSVTACVGLVKKG